jgi:hypothetical protein
LLAPTIIAELQGASDYGAYDADARFHLFRRLATRVRNETGTPCNLAHEFGLASRSLTQRVAAPSLPCALAPAVFKARFDRRDHLKAAVAALAIRHWPTVASRRALVER